MAKSGRQQRRREAPKLSPEMLAVIAEYSGVLLDPVRAKELMPTFEAMMGRVDRTEVAAIRAVTPAHVLLEKNDASDS